MAQMTILLRRNPETGKQTIVVKLDSDPDALPIEHEQMHRKLVETLVGQGLNPEDLGEIVIEREGGGSPGVGTAAPQPAERERVGRKGGG